MNGKPNNLIKCLRASGICIALLLSACGSGGGSSNSLSNASINSSTEPPAAATKASLIGVLHGGQAPIVGSSLTLYAAGVPATAAPSMLGTSTTDSNGNFNILYTCPTAGTLVYVVGVGGNAGGGANSAIKLMAALGSCGSLPSSVVINELTTVAAVYALNAFSNIASNGTGLGGCVDCVPTPQADMTQLHGNSPAINNAFKTAALLTDVTSGQPARSLPPAASCSVSPAPFNCSAIRKLNGLGNVLGSCVNSAGASSSQCTSLFNCAVPNAVPTAAVGFGTLCTVPAGSVVSGDTLQAILSIARNPGVVCNEGLAILQSRSPLFAPASPSLANEATIAINFTDGGINAPLAIAIDSEGDVWTANVGNGISFEPGNSSISELSASGLPLSPAAGFTGGGLDAPNGIAVDNTGNVWVSNFFSPVGEGVGGVSEFNSSGAPLSGSTGFTGAWVANPADIAVDANGNVWTANENGNETVNELSPQGTILSGNGYSPGMPANHFGIAIDGAGNVWVSNENPTSLSELNSNGLPISPSAGFVGGGLNAPRGVAVDSAGNVWIANFGNNSVSEFSSSGQPFSPATGFTGGRLNGPSAIAVDGANHIWVTNAGNGSVTELNSSGGVLSPYAFTGLGSAGNVALLDNPTGIAIDGAGDVWVSNNGNNSVTEFIGAAAPTVTPLVAQITKPGAALVSIAVTPPSASVTDGSTQQFTATGTYADASVRNLSASVTWSSSNTSFATIAAGGLATCVAPGVVDITASITQDGATVSATATQALTCSAPLVSGPSCYPAPANPGGGAQPYDNQSYCVSFTGTTFASAAYSFTGTLSFVTASTPGPLVSCQYWSSGTVQGVSGTQTTGPTACAGSVTVSGGVGTLAIADLIADGNSFSGTFTGSNVAGTYDMAEFGPAASPGGDATGSLASTAPTP